MSRSVSVAVVRGEPPEVFVADDLETLNWIIAVQVIARRPPVAIHEDVRRQLRVALLEERWGDAVAMWIEQVDHEGIDVYESYECWSGRDVATAAHEMQFLPLFEDG